MLGDLLCNKNGATPLQGSPRVERGLHFVAFPIDDTSQGVCARLGRCPECEGLPVPYAV
jgi:hypothetical protein